MLVYVPQDTIQFSILDIFVISVYHCTFSSCGVLQLDLAYPSIFET